MTIERLFAETDIEALRRLIDGAGRVAITCHISPDGDALGSSLGLAAILRRLGKTVHVVTPDFPPASFAFLPGFSDIVVASAAVDTARGLMANCDLLFMLDFSQAKRIDRLAPAVEGSKAPKVVVDHHLFPSVESTLLFSAPEKSSTSMLIFILAMQLGIADMVDRDAATCLMTGMITDTGNFSYSAEDPQLYLIAAELVARGVDKDRITREVLRTYSLDRLRLNLYALSEKMVLFPQWRGALISLTQEELRRFNHRKGDTEGLVNVPLGLPGVDVSVFIRQESDTSKVKVSVRSLDDYPADRLCARFFGGGGHKNAAGGEYVGSLDDAAARVAEALTAFAPAPDSQQ